MVEIYKPYLLDIAVASLLAIATASLHRFIHQTIKNEVVATSFLTFIMALTLFGPIIYFIFTITGVIAKIDPNLISKIASSSLTLLENIPDSMSFLKAEIRETVLEMNIAATSKDVITFFGNIGAKSAVFIKDIVLIVIFYFFAHLYGKEIVCYLKQHIPIEDRSAAILFDETTRMMSVTTYSIVITAIFEGALFAIIAWIFGYNALLFGILYGFASLIPVVGGMLMWVPLGAYEYYLGNSTNALLIVAYSIIVISLLADTFIKPIIIDIVNSKLLTVGKRQVNSLIIFFAIIAGLSTYGFWGMLLGPAVTALFMAMLSVYGSLDENSQKVDISKI
jgi:predicted PurR-regulated permease PerM